MAESEVAMTTVISSHVKDENHIFTGYEIFVTGKILVFHWCLYNKKTINTVVTMPYYLYMTFQTVKLA